MCAVVESKTETLLLNVWSKHISPTKHAYNNLGMELIALVSLWSVGVWIQARPLQSQSLLIKQNSAHFLIAQSTSSQQHLPVNKQEQKYLPSHSDGNSSELPFAESPNPAGQTVLGLSRNAPSSCFKQARYFYQKVVRKAGVFVASCVVTSVMTYLGWKWSSAQESQNPFHSSLVKYYRQQSKVTTSC